jgi:hypothetical protein
MFRTFIAASVVGLALISGALADEGEPGSEEGEQALQPVISDDVAVNPGQPDDQPIEPVLADDGTVNEGTPEDQPLDPVISDDTEVNLPPVAPEPEAEAALIIRVPLRADGTAPEVRLARAGRDAEVWVDGVKRVVLKGRGDLEAGDLSVVFG